MSTSDITSLDAKVCRRSCQVKFRSPAFLTASSNQCLGLINLSPPTGTKIGPSPVRALRKRSSARLYKWRLIERSLDRRGLLLYRLSPRGRERLAWLQSREEGA